MPSILKNWKIAVAALIAFGCIAAPAWALMVRPIVIDLTAAGNGASSSMEVINDRNRPVAVEIKVSSMELPEKGSPVMTENDGADFVIFPTIARIQPGQSQIFRIRYVGDPSIAKSKLYMFSSAELPVEVDPNNKGAQIQMLYSIGSVVTVRPLGSTPELMLASVEKATNSKGVDGVYLTFQNEGASHAYVRNATVALRSEGGWSEQLDANEMGASVGLGLVPAKSRRALFVALPDVPEGNLTGEITGLASR